LCAAKGTAILMISHDLGLVANMCRRVAVMYAGRIVETQVAEAIFATPRHPYTKGLVDSLPLLGERSRRGRQRLREISGVVPSMASASTSSPASAWAWWVSRVAASPHWRWPSWA